MSRLRIVVLGYVVRGPLGGFAWHHLQYVLGLSRLGHDVFFVEDSDDYPSCYQPERELMDTDPTYGLRFAEDALGRLGLGDRWAFYDAHRSRWLGAGASRVAEVCATADCVLNVSGVNPLRPWLERIPERVLIDTDPVFTQVRHLTDEVARAYADRHTAFLSFGENIGRAGCTVPDDGLPWRPTRQPVVLDAWPVTPGPPDGRLTSIMQWDSYAAIEHDGRRYGMKSDSFAPYADLPARVEPVLELAAGIPAAPAQRLRAQGWRILDPHEVSRDPWTYQRFIQRSKAELGVAKHGYVATGSGWFSERSTGYLASGRPTLVQDTGFTEWLPSGTGVLAFSTPDEAAAAVEEIGARYELHSTAARAIAEEHFDAREVLGHLLETVYGARVTSP